MQSELSRLAWQPVIYSLEGSAARDRLSIQPYTSELSRISLVAMKPSRSYRRRPSSDA
jgi:hypothetical protein